MNVPRLKRTREFAVETIPPPPQIRIPLGRLRALVRPGEAVRRGALVARSAPSEAFDLRRHASIGGVVAAADSEIVITRDPELDGAPVPIDATSVADAARAAGLVGMGGAAFPTYLKLERRARPAEWVIVNGSQSEPYVTCDHRVMVEYGEEVRHGLAIAVEALGASRHAIVEGEDEYPGGDERLLVERLTGRELPPGRRPADVGVIVLNVQTARALYRAVKERRPLIDRVVTVDGGAVGRPGNCLVPLGTSVEHLLRERGTDLDRAAAIVCGGPMMGSVVPPDATVTAGTVAVLALADEEVSARTDDPCIRCGRCLEACPYGIPAGLLVRRPTPAVLQCVECGLCEYACPARRRLVAQLRRAKAQVGASAASQR